MQAGRCRTQATQVGAPHLRRGFLGLTDSLTPRLCRDLLTAFCRGRICAMPFNQNWALRGHFLSIETKGREIEPGPQRPSKFYTMPRGIHVGTRSSGEPVLGLTLLCCLSSTYICIGSRCMYVARCTPRAARWNVACWPLQVAKAATHVAAQVSGRRVM